MSHLTLYHGPETAPEPHILSFDRENFSRPHRRLAVADRARLEFQNRCCPICNRVTVEPVELDDARYGKNGSMITGTATLLGFNCNACGHEWSI